MSTMLQTCLFKIFQERRSIRHFDPTFNVTEKEIVELLELASSAPSAWNLQHWKFLVITDSAAKQKLLPITYGQKQVTEASVVVAVLGDLQANLNAEAVYDQDTYMPEKVKADQLAQIKFSYANLPTLPRDEAVRNASLAAMQLMLAAKAKGLDSGPMGGYDAEQLTETFNIPSRYIPVMLIVIGKAAKPAYPSFRLSIAEKIVWNGFTS
ncbi:nitroreductase family protein [Siminovitchia sp. 179-K 8D1 HS]|uniref:nitroreductase family protein n=1 Tax=Siminovitchia sp. 179-K 8D1 HS TaxID=3142385 RepID=UPI0039A21C6C